MQRLCNLLFFHTNTNKVKNERYGGACIGRNLYAQFLWENEEKYLGRYLYCMRFIYGYNKKTQVYLSKKSKASTYKFEFQSEVDEWKIEESITYQTDYNISEEGCETLWDIIIAWKTYPIFDVNVQERNFKIDIRESMHNLNSSAETITELHFFGSPKSVYFHKFKHGARSE